MEYVSPYYWIVDVFNEMFTANIFFLLLQENNETRCMCVHVCLCMWKLMLSLLLILDFMKE